MNSDKVNLSRFPKKKGYEGILGKAKQLCPRRSGSGTT